MLDRLQRLSWPRRFRVRRDGVRVIRAEGSARRADVFVGRDLCLFLAVDAAAVPAKQRNEFVALAVKRAAPFADAEHDVAWRDGHAAVWFWSASEVATRTAGIAASRLRFHAEARHLGAPAENRAELLDVAPDGGVIARDWRHGHLVAERWWSRPPSDHEWTEFLRGAGRAGHSPVPDSAEATLGEQAWDRSASAGLPGVLGQYSLKEWLVVPALLVCLLLGGWVGASARNAMALGALRAEVERLNGAAGDILDARSRGEAALERSAALLALREPMTPARLAAALDTALDGQDWSLRTFALDEAGVLSATVEMPAVDPAALVAALEGTGRLGDASVEIIPNSRQIVLRARVIGRSGAARDAEGGSGADAGTAP